MRPIRLHEYRCPKCGTYGLSADRHHHANAVINSRGSCGKCGFRPLRMRCPIACEGSLITKLLRILRGK